MGILPDVWSPSWVKVHSTHAGFGCISGPQQHGLLRDELSEVGRPRAQAGGQMSKVHDVGMKVLSDVDVVSLCLGEGQLESAEQAH